MAWSHSFRVSFVGVVSYMKPVARQCMLRQASMESKVLQLTLYITFPDLVCLGLAFGRSLMACLAHLWSFLFPKSASALSLLDTMSCD